MVVPYVSAIQLKFRKQLAKEAKRITGVSATSPQFSKRLARILSSKSGVRRLKASYRRCGLSDANGISMSLYAGPEPSAVRKRKRLQSDGNLTAKPTGWLLTGDARLRASDSCANWIQFFEPMKAAVGNFMIPHHGSDYDFNEDLLTSVPHAKFFITANSDDGTRPGKAAVAAAKAQRKRIHKVSEIWRNGITEISGSSALSSRDFPWPNEW